MLPTWGLKKTTWEKHVRFETQRCTKNVECQSFVRLEKTTRQKNMVVWCLGTSWGFETTRRNKIQGTIVQCNKNHLHAERLFQLKTWYLKCFHPMYSWGCGTNVVPRLQISNISDKLPPRYQVKCCCFGGPYLPCHQSANLPRCVSFEKCIGVDEKNWPV